MSFDEMIQKAALDGMRDAIKSRLTQSYNNPFDKHIESAISANAEGIRGLLSECISGCLNDKAFRSEICVQARQILAKKLVSGFGGELEKSINRLKSDPSTRARITVALDEIVSAKV